MKTAQQHMKQAILFSLMSIFSYATYAQNWQLAEKSEVGFRIQSLGLKIVEGKFNQVDAQLWFDEKNLGRASTQFTLYVDGLSLSKPSLAPMIMGKDLFDAAQFKTVQFKSTQFRAKGQQRYDIIGQLSLRGVTRTVRFDAVIRPDSHSPQRLWVNAQTKIARSDFGMRKAVGQVGEHVDIYLKGDWKVSTNSASFK